MSHPIPPDTTPEVHLDRLQWWPRPGSDAYRVTFTRDHVQGTAICWPQEIESMDAVSRAAFLADPASYKADVGPTMLFVRVIR